MTEFWTFALVGFLAQLIDGTLGLEGPMARNVRDLGLLLEAMSGAEPGDPLSLPREAISFARAASEPLKPRRLAVSRNLGIVRDGRLINGLTVGLPD